VATVCEDFRIDVSHEQSFKYLQAVQYDHNSRKRRLIITDSNVPISFKGTEYIVFSMNKDGKNYSNTSCQFENGYPYITFTESMLSEYGDINCGIKVFDHNGGEIISTFNFKMTISKSLMNYDRLVESSEFNVLNDLILQALHISELLKDYESNKTIIDQYIIQINKDIQNYRSGYTSLSNDAQKLINDVETFLNTSQTAETSRVTAENARVEAENKRQENVTNKINDIENRTAAAISDIENRTQAVIKDTNNARDEAIASANDTRQAISEAQDATDNAYESATSAAIARDQCLAAIENLHWEIVSLDGGYANSSEETYENEYDGGNA